jgi:hypothetical protein
MGTAHASYSFEFYGVQDFVECTAHMLRVLTDRWVRPLSLQVYVPGHADAKRPDTFAKLPGSLDGPRPTTKPDGERLFPGERLLENAGVTALEPSGSLPAWPRDLDETVDLVRQFLQRADRLRKLGADPHAWVYGSFWGNTRIVVPAAGDLTTCWALREQICFSNANVFELIAGFSFEAEAASDLHAEDTFSFHFSTYSHIWSHYEPRFDVARDAWPLKADLTAARKNAQIVAATIAELIRSAPAVEFAWDFDREHSPDVAGDLPEELNRRLGADRVRKPTANVMLFG